MKVQRALAHVVRREPYVDTRLAGIFEARARLDAPKALSSREQEGLRRAALGESNKDIPEALTIAVKTVEVHQ